MEAFESSLAVRVDTYTNTINNSNRTDIESYLCRWRMNTKEPKIIKYSKYSPVFTNKYFLNSHALIKEDRYKKGYIFSNKIYVVFKFRLKSGSCILIIYELFKIPSIILIFIINVSHCVNISYLHFYYIYDHWINLHELTLLFNNFIYYRNKKFETFSGSLVFLRMYKDTKYVNTSRGIRKNIIMNVIS